MAFKHTLKRGSTRPALRYPLPGVDLTGASVMFLMSPRPGQPATVNAPAVVANGVLEYHWQHGDTNNAVMHYGEFEVVFPGGAIETFPADDYIRIEVKQDIGDGGTVAPPALIILTGALVEAGSDAVSGAGAVSIALSGALVETGSDTAAGTGLALPAAVPPAVANAQNGGYAGTTPSVAADGTVTITNVASAITGEHGVSHYLVRADNMQGKTLTVRRSAGSPNDIGNDLSVWQMAWAYDPEGEWSAFDSVVNSSGTIVATENTPMTQPSVYIARRPVFTNARWDAAIARWRASPHTSPTASGDANFVIGTLPANSHAPAMDAYGFKFGTGPKAIVVTGNIHVEEHIAAYAYEAFVDWLLGDSAEATWLRGEITVYCYPKINPQSRYAGASRQEVVSGENANRIFSSAYDNIPLSKLMRDAWAADLPATITGALDFHDVPPGPRRAEMFYSGEGEFASRLAARYKARTGLDATIFPPNTTAGMIATYMLQNFGATWTTTPEHGILNTVGVPEWQTWGLDVAATLHDYVLNPPGQIDWITPAWTSTNTSTVTTNANGSVTVANAGNPGASFRIPDGASIEVVIDLTLANANIVFLRHSAVASLDPAQSVELDKRLSSTAPYYRVQQITWDATRPYFGVFAARQNTANPASYTLLPSVKYRVISNGSSDVTLSGALIEAGADTASGTASVGITASAALVETGADTAAGTGAAVITASAALSEYGADVATGMGSVSPPQSVASPYQPDMTTGRIAPITTSFGGRPNVVPASYYFDGQDEMAPMMQMMVH